MAIFLELVCLSKNFGNRLIIYLFTYKNTPTLICVLMPFSCSKLLKCFYNIYFLSILYQQSLFVLVYILHANIENCYTQPNMEDRESIN